MIWTAVFWACIVLLVAPPALIFGRWWAAARNHCARCMTRKAVWVGYQLPLCDRCLHRIYTPRTILALTRLGLIRRLDP